MRREQRKHSVFKPLKCLFRVKSRDSRTLSRNKTSTKLQVKGSHCPSLKIGKEYRDKSFEEKNHER